MLGQRAFAGSDLDDQIGGLRAGRQCDAFENRRIRKKMLTEAAGHG
jgi:hypothetical protein